MAVVVKTPDFIDKTFSQIESQITGITRNKLNTVISKYEKVVANAESGLFTTMVEKVIDKEAMPDFGQFNPRAGWSNLTYRYAAYKNSRRLRLGNKKEKSDIRELNKSLRSDQSHPNRFYLFSGRLRTALLKKDPLKTFGTPKISIDGKNKGLVKRSKNNIVLKDVTITFDLYPKVDLAVMDQEALAAFLFPQRDREKKESDVGTASFYKLAGRVGHQRPFIRAFLKWYASTVIKRAVDRVKI
jgi:hypothetical protein